MLRQRRLKFWQRPPKFCGEMARKILTQPSKKIREWYFSRRKHLPSKCSYGHVGSKFVLRADKLTTVSRQFYVEIKNVFFLGKHCFRWNVPCGHVIWSFGNTAEKFWTKCLKIFRKRFLLYWIFFSYQQLERSVDNCAGNLSTNSRDFSTQSAELIRKLRSFKSFFFPENVPMDTRNAVLTTLPKVSEIWPKNCSLSKNDMEKLTFFQNSVLPEKVPSDT